LKNEKNNVTSRYAETYMTIVCQLAMTEFSAISHCL